MYFLKCWNIPLTYNQFTHFFYVKPFCHHISYVYRFVAKNQFKSFTTKCGKYECIWIILILNTVYAHGKHAQCMALNAKFQHLCCIYYLYTCICNYSCYRCVCFPWHEDGIWLKGRCGRLMVWQHLLQHCAMDVLSICLNFMYRPRCPGQKGSFE